MNPNSPNLFKNNQKGKYPLYITDMVTGEKSFHEGPSRKPAERSGAERSGAERSGEGAFFLILYVPSNK
jgi:hypothetical protein